MLIKTEVKKAERSILLLVILLIALISAIPIMAISISAAEPQKELSELNETFAVDTIGITENIIKGDVDGDKNVSISDVLEILKYLADMDNEITKGGTESRAWAAAMVLDTRVSDCPDINDALEILKKLARMLNVIDIPNLDKIEKQWPSSTLKQGETLTLPKKFSGAYFESFDASVATVTKDGVVTAKINGGLANILCYVNGEIKIIYSVKILPSTTALKVVDIIRVMNVGEVSVIKTVITPKNSVERVEYSSNNPSIASVSENGEIRALSVGRAEITIKSGKFSQKRTVTVELPAINITRLNLVEGERNDSLKINDTTCPITWRSSNPSVAVVDRDGKVTAKTQGYTCIIAEVGTTKLYTDVTVINNLEQSISSLQNKYPEGYYWNYNTPDAVYPEVTQTPCYHQTDNPILCKGQCAGFAMLLSDEVFGKDAPKYTVNGDIYSIRQGDYVRYSNRPNHYHSVFVIRVIKPGDIIGYDRATGQHIKSELLNWKVAHCNWGSDCGILWYHDYFPEFRVQTLYTNESYSRMP